MYPDCMLPIFSILYCWPVKTVTNKKEEFTTAVTPAARRDMITDCFLLSLIDCSFLILAEFSITSFSSFNKIIFSCSSSLKKCSSESSCENSDIINQLYQRQCLNYFREIYWFSKTGMNS